MTKLEAFNYNEETDDSICRRVDKFEPVSEPKHKYFVMPDHVKYEFIATEEDVKKLLVLKSDKFIGVDSEWRPGLTSYYITKPSLF